MHAEFIISIILFRYLQTHDNTKTLAPKWEMNFRIGMIASIIILILGSSLGFVRPFAVWITHFMLFGMMYLSQTRSELSPLKPYFKVVLPVVAVHSIKDLLKLFSPPGIEKFTGLFETAEAFVFIWFVATLVIVRRQENALKKQELKTLEQEKEIVKAEGMKLLLEKQVNERTLELRAQKEELQDTLANLRDAQDQLIHSEKMASLGELTAGIAHEIQNPLNFVNNFSAVSKELIQEIKEERSKEDKDRDFELENEILDDLEQNLGKIFHHGGRASSIVKGMLDHSRASTEDRVETDINALCDEYLRLSYHGLRAKDKSFNSSYKKEFDQELPGIHIVPQEVGRVILNIVNNAFYAVDKKNKELSSPFYEPLVTISTSAYKKKSSKNPEGIKICISDNGIGMSQEVCDKIFQPFFTTKPTGEGTGLGLSLSYDIITQGHNGTLDVESQKGEGSKFIIKLPLT